MRSPESGFTRLELLAMLAALALCLAAAGPLFANTRPSSTRAVCFNNLRQIGIAVQRWGNEHDEFAPWTTLVSKGGTKPDAGSKAGNAWAEFITLSNELTTAHVLACPQDSATKAADNFSSQANGFANSGFRANALSYFISYHGQPTLPFSVITGDRDFSVSEPGGRSCPRGNVINSAPVGNFGQPIRWTNAVHADAGNLLRYDGSVVHVSNTNLPSALIQVPGDSGSIHLIPAR